MAIYDELVSLIKGNRGDRLDIMVSLVLGSVAVLVNGKKL